MNRVGKLALFALGAAVVIGTLSRKTESANEPLDYGKPVFTRDYAVVCPQTLLVKAAFDLRADHGPQEIYGMFAAAWDRGDRAKKLGCEEWRGGIRTFALRMDAPLDHFVEVSVGSTRDSVPTLFTMESELTNGVTPAQSNRELAASAEQANQSGAAALEAKNYVEAMKWYRVAADQGLAKAQYNIGVLYADGLGVRKDYPEAAAWFRKAADKGFAAAQYNIGVLYESGTGVPKDIKEARRWYDSAAAQGYSDAIIARKELAATTRTDVTSEKTPP